MTKGWKGQSKRHSIAAKKNRKRTIAPFSSGQEISFSKLGIVGGQGIGIDKNIAQAIKIMNENGIETKETCEGHDNKFSRKGYFAWTKGDKDKLVEGTIKQFYGNSVKIDEYYFYKDILIPYKNFDKDKIKFLAFMNALADKSKKNNQLKGNSFNRRSTYEEIIK